MAAIWMSVSLGFLPALAFGTLRNGKKRSLWFRGLVENCVVYGEVSKRIRWCIYYTCSHSKMVADVGKEKEFMV